MIFTMHIEYLAWKMSCKSVYSGFHRVELNSKHFWTISTDCDFIALNNINDNKLTIKRQAIDDKCPSKVQ